MLLSQLNGSWLYAERYVNNFKKVANEVRPEYCAMLGASSFFLPYVQLGLEQVTFWSAGRNDQVEKAFFPGKGMVNFFLHPETLVDNPSLINNDDLHWDVEVVPTASTRTVVPVGADYAIKTHLDKRLSRFIRRLRPSSVEHSVAVSSELERIARNAPESFAFFPESLGIAYKDIGMLVRELIPHPVVKKESMYLPLFSLYSQDQKCLSDSSLLEQLLSRTGEDPLVWVEKNIIIPLFEHLAYVWSSSGLLLEPHGQNVVLEFNHDYKVTRLVHRDFQSMYVARERMQFPFAKHLMGAECQAAVSYSLVFDQYIGQYVFDPLSLLLQEKCGVAQESFVGMSRQCFSEIMSDDLRECFPAVQFHMKKGVFDGNTTEFVAAGVPRYRP
ncbi:MAG: IucA/IucC family protein [Nanoarchaeota archaeon]|nr:IucA/IucC family protein [Nanoarchaeota archaeon]